MTTALLVLSLAAWSFAEEDVRITVASQSFELTATYTFRCAPGAPDLPILYPFPSDSSLGPPEPIVVALVGEDEALRPLNFHVSRDGWRWVVPGGDVSVRRVRVMYRQAMGDSRAAYVLRSTQRWKSPLDRAQLKVEVPLGTNVSITPALEPVVGAGQLQAYCAEFRDWMPESDLLVQILGATGSR